MQLTAEQQSSFDTLAYWLLTPEQHLVIDGPAGAKLMAPYTVMCS